MGSEECVWRCLDLTAGNSQTNKQMNIGRKPLTDADFLAMWTCVERELECLAAGELCSASTVYNCIYSVCTSPASRFEAKMYWKIGDFIYLQAKGIRREIFDAEDWVEAYNAGFRRFRRIVFAVNELCDFLNECVRGRTMQDFGFLLWERCILQQTMKYKNTTLGFELATQDRVGIVREAIESLRLVVPDPRHPLLYYTQKYEQLALEKMKARYENEISAMDVDVSAYSLYVKERILHEKSIRDKIFLEESWPKMEAVLEEVFVLSRREYLSAEIHRTMLQHRLPVEILESIRAPLKREETCSKEETTQNQENDFYELQTGISHVPGNSSALESVSVLYKNLYWLGSAYEILMAAFVQYINGECERCIHVYGRDIESLYLLYCMLRNVVDGGCMGDAEFFKVLKREFAAACTRLKPSLETRLIDFSDLIVGNGEVVESTVQNLLDPLLFKPFQTPADTGDRGSERDVLLQRVFAALYKLIEKKQEFYDVYLARLGRRLLECRSSPLKEKRLVGLMKRKENHDFMRKAETMINDINISLHYNKDPGRFVWMLTQAYWPVQADGMGMEVPEALQAIRKTYDFKFSKKRIYWAWHLGSVCVEMCQREIRMNVPQYSVMDLFNRHAEISMETVMQKTKAGRMAEDILRSLSEAGLVEQTGDVYRMSEDIGGVEGDVSRFYRCEGAESVREIDRGVYYQSLVSQIVKRSKRIEADAVAKEAMTRHTGCFEFDAPAFGESIAVLLEKGIMEEAGELYVYLP